MPEVGRVTSRIDSPEERILFSVSCAKFIICSIYCWLYFVNYRLTVAKRTKINGFSNELTARSLRCSFRLRQQSTMIVLCSPIRDQIFRIFTARSVSKFTVPFGPPGLILAGQSFVYSDARVYRVYGVSYVRVYL